MEQIKEAMRLYGRYMSLNIRSAMQHKASFFLQIAGQLMTSLTTFVGLFFMFQRFHRVKGYTYSDVLLCFSIVLMQFSLAEMFARGFDAFSGMVRRGEFDRVLVRPRNEALQVLGSRFELTRIGRLLQAVIIFIYGMATTGVTWTAGRVLTVLIMLLGGTALFSGLFLVYAALCFFTIEGLEFMNVFTDGGREYGKYPSTSTAGACSSLPRSSFPMRWFSTIRCNTCSAAATAGSTGCIRWARCCSWRRATACGAWAWRTIPPRGHNKDGRIEKDSNELTKGSVGSIINQYGTFCPVMASASRLFCV